MPPSTTYDVESFFGMVCALLMKERRALQLNRWRCSPEGCGVMLALAWFRHERASVYAAMVVANLLDFVRPSPPVEPSVDNEDGVAEHLANMQLPGPDGSDTDSLFDYDTPDLELHYETSSSGDENSVYVVRPASF